MFSCILLTDGRVYSGWTAFWGRFSSLFLACHFPHLNLLSYSKCVRQLFSHCLCSFILACCVLQIRRKYGRFDLHYARSHITHPICKWCSAPSSLTNQTAIAVRRIRCASVWATWYPPGHQQPTTMIFTEKESVAHYAQYVFVYLSCSCSCW